MKVAVINFSGNVGKSTVARHLLSPRMENAEVISVETINADGAGEQIKGKQFGDLQEFLMTVDEAVIDVGASNVEDFVKLMKQYHGSHEDFDYFVVPVVKEAKQQKDTIATIDALSALGIPAKKIRLVFNMLEEDESPEVVFPGMFAYREDEKKFTIREDAIIIRNDVYEKLKGLNKTLPEILSDETDYRAKLKAAQSQEEKELCVRMISVKRLAVSAMQNLDSVFKVTFK